MKRNPDGGVLPPLFVAVSLIFIGCDDSSNSTTRQKKTPKGGSAGSGHVLTEARCNEILGQALDMLQPDRLGVTSEQAVAVDLLNQWLTGCGAQVQVGPAATDELRGAITQAAWERVRESHFGPRDAEHIRDGLLFRAMNQVILGGAETDRERVVRLFDYVARNIALEKPEDHLPLRPYEIVVFGRGSVEDRAWIFAELLRQFRIEALIVRPGADAASQDDAKPQDWLVGAVVGDKVYLFDPKRGSAVPAAESAAGTLSVTPATLEEFASGEGASYRSPRVEVIGSSSYWAERMQRLQESLTGDRSVVVYDPLLAAAGGSLARARELGQGRWEASDTDVWTYPEEQWIASENMDPQTAARREARWAPFSAPVPVADVGAGQEIQMGRPQYEQLKNRLRQLMGELPKAVTNYLSIRMTEQQPPVADDKYVAPEFYREILARLPTDVQRIHREAAEDALFWTGSAQLEMGQQDAASRPRHDAAAYSTLRAYLQRYPQGEWSDHVRLLVAGILVRADQNQIALQLVQDIDPASPQAAELQFIADRLKAAPSDSTSDPAGQAAP